MNLWPYPPGNRGVWHRCIHEMQTNIMESMRVNFVSENLHSSIPLLHVDPAYHGNFGDTLISYGEKVLIERLGFKNSTECGIVSSVNKNQACKNFSAFENGPGIAFWHGGGNWGDLWTYKSLHLRRMETMTELVSKGYNVIGMTQSFFYKDLARAVEDAKVWGNALLQAKVTKTMSKRMITLAWRQQNSYERALELYPFVNNVKLPDVAFMVGPLPDTDKWSSIKEKYDVLFLLRQDYESVIMKETKDKPEKYIKKLILANRMTKRLKFKVADWYSNKWEFLNKSISNPSADVDLEYKVTHLNIITVFHFAAVKSKFKPHPS